MVTMKKPFRAGNQVAGMVKRHAPICTSRSVSVSAQSAITLPCCSNTIQKRAAESDIAARVTMRCRSSALLVADTGRRVTTFRRWRHAGDQPMAKVCFIGFGKMGSAMAARLLTAGHHLSIYNRTASRAAPLVRLGANFCDTPRAACDGVDAVISMVADDQASRSVWLGPDGVL